MQITNIKESGANNVLLWAIKNEADIFNDQQLQSLINDELFYIVTLTNVNFLELFRLSQMYRDRLRIVKESKAVIPPQKELMELFKGSCAIDENQPEVQTNISDIVENCCQAFINLVIQMGNDNDIISPGALRLFLPMITRKFEVQFPVAFGDFIMSISEDEANALLTSEYPRTLESIIENPSHGFIRRLQLGLVKSTSIVKYNTRYDKYLHAVKYGPLKNIKTNKVYKIGLLGFFKYDNVSKGTVNCSLFNLDKETMVKSLKRLGQLTTPLKVQFIVEMPIQYMQILVNSFSSEMLTVEYESSMTDIIDTGLEFHDFILPYEGIERELTEDEQAKMTEVNNAVEEYSVRIAEANQIMMNSISLMLKNPDTDISDTDIFSVLPSIYKSKAVITIDVSDPKKYLNQVDPVLSEVFEDIFSYANQILEDISGSNN